MADICLVKEITFDYISKKMQSGSMLKTTKLTVDFDFSAYLEFYEKDVVLLFIITEDQQLQVIDAETEIIPKPNQTVISLVPKEPKS